MKKAVFWQYSPHQSSR